MEKSFYFKKGVTLSFSVVPALGLMLAYQGGSRHTFALILPFFMIELEVRKKQKEIDGVTNIN